MMTNPFNWNAPEVDLGITEEEHAIALRLQDDESLSAHERADYRQVSRYFSGLPVFAHEIERTLERIRAMKAHT
jgi:hypothetical protein